MQSHGHNSSITKAIRFYRFHGIQTFVKLKVDHSHSVICVHLSSSQTNRRWQYVPSYAHISSITKAIQEGHIKLSYMDHACSVTCVHHHSFHSSSQTNRRWQYMPNYAHNSSIAKAIQEGHIRLPYMHTHTQADRFADLFVLVPMRPCVAH